MKSGMKMTGQNGQVKEIGVGVKLLQATQQVKYLKETSNNVELQVLPQASQGQLQVQEEVSKSED